MIEAALAGTVATTVFEVDRQFDVAVRLSPQYRDSIEAIGGVKIAYTPPNATVNSFIPLRELATITLDTGASFIYREKSRRNLPVKFNVRGRDLGSTIAEAQARVKRSVQLPSGYEILWVGEFDNMMKANKRLSVVAPVTLLAIVALLFVAACQSTPNDTGNAVTQGAAAAGGGGVTAAAAPAGGGGGAAAATNPGGPAAGTRAEFEQVVGDRVFFDFDKFDLTPLARGTLERQAAWLKRYPGARIVVEGHCDERGTREYNLALGERRATASKNYLVALGIDASRITTISYGKEKPAATGSNETAWALNRRAVSVVSGVATN